MDEKALSFEVIVDAPIESVWDAWTTVEGVTSFFAPECKIELRPGGAYEMYFDLDAQTGLRGGEGCQILAIEELTMLSFTWNAPPEYPKIREQRTHVCVRFVTVEINKTLVALTQDGWGYSPDWQATYHYFESAWGEVVLPRLQERFRRGPHLWNNSNRRRA
ncbi:MAG: SRPBCC domain-containing protein [Anaerolineaceae bacterium]